VSVQEDPERKWLDQWSDALAIVDRWERYVGHLLPSDQATELTRQISMGLQRAYERGRAAQRTSQN
jgi:hypothetical protein